jgi:hypothetical protein
MANNYASSANYGALSALPPALLGGLSVDSWDMLNTGDV